LYDPPDWQLRRAPLALFFFFQAEDGIRDGHVTGVQTCALPISSPRTERYPVRGDAGDRSRRARPPAPPRAPRSRGVPRARSRERSEERRVGKECRARWWG